MSELLGHMFLLDTPNSFNVKRETIRGDFRADAVTYQSTEGKTRLVSGWISWTGMTAEQKVSYRFG